MVIRLPFEPVACPRPKIAIRSGYPSAYYPPKYKIFKSNVTAYLKSNYPDIRFDGAVYITYTFIFKRPKSLQRKINAFLNVKNPSC